MNYDRIIKEALKEDIGRKDITTEIIIPKDKIIKAVLLAKEDCMVCGLDIAEKVFKIQDKQIIFKPLTKDGKYIKKGRIIARIKGRARAILTSERVALNFLSLLSGIATKTSQYVKAVRPYKVKIMDTRKTIPGLRQLEKYAVCIGGGYNHRMRLDEMILVKDNHLQITHNYLKLPKLTHNYWIELEVKSLREFKEALKLKPDVIMLDNMTLKEMKKAVEIRNKLQITNYKSQIKSKKLILEASGGITLKNIKKIAATGVEMISLGTLTHSVNSVDISLEVQ